MSPSRPLSMLASLTGISLEDLELQSTTLMGNLGMDSLTATRLRAALIPQPSYQTLYGLTVSEVAAKLSDISATQHFPQIVEDEKIPHSFRLTPMQESYLIGSNQGCPCQVYSEFDIENLDIHLFEQAVQSVIDRHPMLHAKIVSGSQQAIRSPKERSLQVYFKPLEEIENWDQRRQECISVFQKNSDLHWDIQFSKLGDNKVRIHLLLDMLFIDATSAMLLFHQVSEAYHTLLNDNYYCPSVSPKIEFWNYCNQLESKKISPSSLEYWEERFQWIPGPPQLPRLKQSGNQAIDFQRISFTLEENEWSALKSFALQLQITANALLLAIFAEVLRFYSEEPTFSIAVTMSERPLSIENDFSQVVGEFTNVLICPISAQRTAIGKAAQKIHEDLCKSLEHLDFSGLEVIRKLRKHRADPHLSFPVVFTSFIGVVRPDIGLKDCKATLHFQQTQTPQINLDHQVYEWDGKLYVNWDYDSHVYEKELMADMLRCFYHLSKQVAKDHSCLPSLPPELIERRLTINQTHRSWDPKESFLLHDLILNTANKTPNATAVIDQDAKFTYYEITTIARRIAYVLQEKGIGPNSCVAVVMEKGWEQVVATLGILLTGAFYLPLDPTHPDERLRHILSIANCKIALVQSRLMVRERSWWQDQSDLPLKVIPLDRGLSAFSEEKDLVSVNVHPDQLAYVIFTSGSTGEPKGVEITHRGAVNTCLDINERFGFQKDTVTFGISALNFDLSVWDIFGTLGAGGIVVICKPDGTRDPDYWWEQLQQHQINIWNSVPTSFEMLIASRPPSAILPLKLALLSGDAISMSMLENARILFPHLKIVALGGATEASIWSNFHVITTDSWNLNTQLAPYGKPLSNQTMYILDSQWNYRPDRVVGDIYIGGLGLARGYFGDPELTANKFLMIEPFGRLYATGDIGRYLPNGEIEILGRKDSQVKVGGYRVELAEIASCAEHLVFVNKAAVIHLPDKGDRLVGFITTNEVPQRWEEDLRLYIDQHLPNYMAPQIWIKLDYLPLTNNNKIDIKKLRHLCANFLEQNQSAKSEENESGVALILQTAAHLIGVSATNLSPTHSLMEQGLSSLLVVQFINLIAAKWNTRLPYTLVFNYPTAIQLANFYKNLTFKEAPSVHRTSEVSKYSSEPIAIIGVACRLPGRVFSPEEFWTMLLNGTDCITKVPSNRFDIEEIYNSDPNKIGFSYTRHGAFMDGVDSFDHCFFNIPVAEASAMDPQQRIFLEVAYEAFYVAGYNTQRLKGSPTGVFVGQMNYDWMTDFSHTTDYAGTVVAPSITSNRVSFTFDLSGPSMTIDTACSSSLVAVDAAITKLRSGACKMALAGGVNIILCPTPYITTCQARMLSIHHRCATFDIDANGIARGEGVGAVVLKRLSDAQAAGDPILAIIRGSCVNQDGKTASLTAPSGLAQEAAIRSALADAGVDGRDIDYVECHGTGTPLGDPIEVEALKNTLNNERNKPVVLGAVKTNIGHLEGAAGIIGLIKTIEVLRHRQAPPNLHFQALNPKIDLQGFPAVIPTRPTILGNGEKQEILLAGVSSFGYGGTNAHIILQSWNDSNIPQPVLHSDMLWMFTGQGSIQAGSAHLLYEQNQIFKDALDRYTSFLQKETGIALLDLLIGADTQGLLQKTQYGQPALVILQLAQMSMWQSRGVMPSMVLGHSIGEFAAAVLAGVMEPETACRLAAIRGKLMSDSPIGSMAAVFVEAEMLQPILPKNIFVAAKNGPSMTVLSGEKVLLTQFLQTHFEKESQYTFLPVSHAFHSPFMQQAAEAFREHIQLVELCPPQRVDFISTLTGDKETSKITEPSYWVDQMLYPVQFLKAVKTALHLSPQIQTVIEIGPSATLINMAKRFALKEQLKWVASHESVRYVPKEHLFQNIRLPWKEPLKKQTEDTEKNTNLENYIYETNWVPIETNSLSSDQQLPLSCLVLTGAELDISHPQDWVIAVVRQEEDLLKIVSQKNWDIVLLISSGFESDVELGLRLLQFASHDTHSPIEHIFFVTSPLSTLDAGLWGLARTIHQERPDIDVRCIECKIEDAVNAVLLAIEHSDEEEFSFSEQDGLKVPRIIPFIDTLPTQDLSICNDATYIISGGQGALGLVAAELLLKRGAKYLLLLSRNPQPLDAFPQLASFKQQANIKCLNCDVSQKEDVINIKDWLFKQGWPEIRGIIHTAGVLTDNTIPNQSKDSLKIAFGAKVQGACHLRSVFSPPDFLILFSSITALFGSAGQASYAAANATLDALAFKWSQAGESVLSIQWGAWSEVGMAARQDTLKRIEMLGFGLVSTNLGAKLLEKLIVSKKWGTICVSPIRWDQLKIKSGRFNILKNSSNPLNQKVQKWSRSKLQTFVRDCILQFISPDKVKGNPSFMEAGFSSLDLVQLRQRLMSDLPDFIELPVHFAFNYPTEQDVVDYLVEQFKSKLPEKKAPTKLWSSLNEKTAGTPLFLISGVVGNIEKTFGTLAAAVSHPVYALKPAVPAYIDLDKTTIEIIAREIKESMLKEVPLDTYTVGGLSFGATLALELGLQLEKEGKLTKVILIDPRHMPPFRAPSSPAPFEVLLEHYSPSGVIKSPVILFQCSVPPKENQSEMMLETSRSFQDDKTILTSCQKWCSNLELVRTDGHHFNILYKHVQPVVAHIEQSFREQPTQDSSDEPIAVLSGACRLPGNVRSREEFWQMLVEGKNCVTEIPYSRFEIDEVYNPNPDALGCSYTRFGAFMSGVENFDYDFFGISLAEARIMDPQQRLLLEVAYEAFYQAGYDKQKLRASATGVYIGLANDDWTTMGRDREAYSPYFSAGVSGSIVSNRISYILGLTGPSMAIDTACSSSLVAVDLAVEKLRRGICSLALVGGVNVMLHHRMFVSACATKALSKQGRCATFDASADGYCRGEGVGAVVLKRLSDAQADGDPILAVIRGTAVNQDGRTVSLTAPNGLAQEAVIQQALTVAGIKGQDIDYVECHGTGTPLGDPIEVASLKTVLGKDRKKPLILGAVKTNIGHLEGAAGVIGLIKAIEVLRHRQAPKIVHFSNLNSQINLEDFNAIIPTQIIPLGSPLKLLLAGISSFGFGGTNAHVILESYESGSIEKKAPISYKPYFLPWRRLPHPFLGYQKEENKFVITLSGERAGMWKDHCINQNVLVPAASHITLLGGAALIKHKPQALGVEIRDITFPHPLILKGEPQVIECICRENQWILKDTKEEFANCEGTQFLSSHEKSNLELNIQDICERCIPTNLEPLYTALAQQGVQFGPHYRNLTELFLGEQEAIARIQIKPLPPGERALTLIHPATLDAGIQLLGLCGIKTCGVCVPFHIQTARLFSIEDQPEELWAYAQVSGITSKGIEGTITLFNETGQIFAILEGLTCRRFGVATQVEEILFETEWSPLPASNKTPLEVPEDVLILSRTPIDVSIPDNWRTLLVKEIADLPSLLEIGAESKIVLLSSGLRSDVEFGLKLLQIISTDGKLRKKEIIFVTSPGSDADAGLWGLARTFRLEHTDIRLRCVECTGDRISDIFCLPEMQENELSLHQDHTFYVRRLRRFNQNRSAPSIKISSEATYIISGGQGALGLVVAQFLVERGAKYLLLLSRGSRPTHTIPELIELSKYAKIESFPCDVSQEESIEKARNWLLRHAWPIVQGIVHTAGILTDGTIPNQSGDKLKLAFGPKVDGARYLRSTFRPSDFFILFSSAAATFGSPGQASYAAANTTMDALAENWARNGEPVLSIQWGAWSEVGMAVRYDAVKRAEASGFGSISPSLAKHVLSHLFESGKRGVICVSPIDWDRLPLDIPLISRFRFKRIDPLNTFLPSLSHYTPNELLELVHQKVKEAIGREVDEEAPLMANGMDSLSAVVLAQTLSQALGLSLGSVFALNYPTIKEMVNALVALLGEAPSSVAEPPTPPIQHYEESIAVIGTACRLPGNIGSVKDFWEMLLAGTDCVSEIPYSRFDIDEVYDPNPNAIGRSYTRHGAFMSAVEEFDCDFFDILIAEARTMDPHQRLLLEVAYEAFYKAGYDKKRLRGSSTGVFVGVANQDWTLVCGDQEVQNPFFGVGVSSSIISNRISYLLGLTGPSMTLDTACSSSLVAVDLAVEKLRNGVCSIALVGGVNIMLHSRTFVGCCSANMLSFKGRCATFDASADGYCRGEGVGAVVLKRLSDAKADGDQILAVIRGTAVNQDGRSATLTAPNGVAQEAVIQQALNVAGLKGEDIDYVECHGTGTLLGDPIEVSALKKVMGKGRKKPLVLGAVKTNIGHLEGAAGIVGLIKTVEVLRHRTAPGIVHFHNLNPKIDVTDFNVLIPSTSIPIYSNSGTSLLAGVSSFGFGGTNAHVILESYEGIPFEQKNPPSYKPRFLPWRRFPHPFLTQEAKNRKSFNISLSGERSSMWQDHCINGEVVIPAASHITFLGGAALLNYDSQDAGIEIRDITLLRPLIIENLSGKMSCIFKDQQWILQDENEKFASCQSSNLLTSNDKVYIDFDPEEVRKRCNSVDVEILYSSLAQQGMQFGPDYRNLNELFMGEDEAIAHVCVKSLSTGERSLTLIHPITLDAGIQLLGLSGIKTCGVCIPFHIQTARLFSIEDQPQKVWAYARVSRRTSTSIEGNVTLFGETGEVFAVLEGLTCRKFGADTKIEETLFETEWVPLPPLSTAPIETSKEVIVLSRLPLEISIPSHWRAFTILKSDSFLLSSNSWSQLIFIVQEIESDLELGLDILQQLTQIPSLQNKEVIFVIPTGNVRNAGLWGLVRTFLLENPGAKVCCVESNLDWLEQISSLQNKYPFENEFFIHKKGEISVRRLSRFQQITPSQPILIHSDATYVISGGQGALGIAVTEFLIEQGAKYVLHLCRTPRPIETIPNLLKLSHEGKIECLAVDVAEQTAVLKAREWLLNNGWPRVQGIVHTAGVLTDGTIPNQSNEKIERAFEPKVQGANNLHATFSLLDFLILFSSAAATFGSPGQASYAAANATMDALAENWARNGEPVLSIQWGAWSEVGMAVRHDAVKRAETAGFGSIPSNLGKAILAHLLNSGKKGVVCASPIDWSSIKLNTPLISRFRSEQRESMKATSSSMNLPNEINLLEIIRQAVTVVIGKTVTDEAPLMANGLDSLSAVILAQTLSQKLNLSLGSVFVLNHPTIKEIVKVLETQVQKKTHKVELLSHSPFYSEDPIAVVSIACRLPGNVSSSDEFWEMLLSGADCVTDIPPSRFDIMPFYDPNPNTIGRSYTRKGAFMSEVESFDHEFFGIPIVEALAMDPQQRLLLEVAYESFYAAGYEKENLHNLPIGVFIGQMNQDWAHMHTEEKIADPYFGAGSAASITSNRISYLLGLTGPSMTLDTACSSSLVAVDLAVEKLRSGVCSAALVGGVNVMLSHRSFVGCCSAKMLSFKGRCATFDASADGYCRGEGVGAVVLKRLKDAKADGNQILAIIRGTAVNQDGRSASLTAPNGLAQEAVIKRALEVAGLKGCDVDYIECHGTGTSLGDPIEVGALKNVLNIQRKKPVVLGAVKTNIGHLEGAAGVIGLIKAIEVLRHRKVPGNVHFKTLNPKIDLGDFPAIISNQLTSLDTNKTLIAGVSSFGFGGTNAHVVLESAETLSP